VTTLTAGANFQIDTDQFNVSGLLSGSTSNRSSTAFDVNVGSGYVEHYTGTGLTYDSSYHLVSGTITGLSETYFGDTVFAMTSLNIDAASWVQWVQNGDNAAAIAAIFGGNDSITGSLGDDRLNGREGHDIILGNAGSDTIIGGEGNEHLYGQSPGGGTDSGDSISGGAGSDYIQGNAGNDTLDGGDGTDRINGGKDQDLISLGIGNDSANGNLGNDTIDGGDGNDSLRGGRDDDVLTGGNGDDFLQGDLGNDTVTGGVGFDTLTGGDGTDTFRFSGNDALYMSGTTHTDVITDYTDGSDKIALGFTVNAVLTGSAQSSLAAGMTYAQQLLDGHGGTGEVAAIQIGTDNYLFYSSNGGATVDSVIDVKAAATSAFDTSDFV